MNTYSLTIVVKVAAQNEAEALLNVQSRLIRTSDYGGKGEIVKVSISKA